MSLIVVHGKPGSGKSCYVVSILTKVFSDWVKYHNDKGEIFPRVLYTNIPLNIEAVNDYLVKEMSLRDVDISPNIVLIDDHFFISDDWWEQFPQGAYIVIDEVHHWLPSGCSYKSSDVDKQKKFMNYISTHRHRQQDLIFLTQHIDNVSFEVKKQAEQVFEVINIKSMKVGMWPFVLPMADIDVVREAFGIPQQFAHIKRGVCEARRVVYDKVAENFVLTKSIFNLYRSHTMSQEALDRPSLRLSRFGSLLWIFRRHVIRFTFWGCIVIGIVFSILSFFRNAPDIVMSALTHTVPNSNSELNSDQVKKTVSDNVDDKIIGFVRNGVITVRGVLRKGSDFCFEGNIEKIQSVNFKDKVVFFDSGKKCSK
ncbi:MAG: zonular occludens toxin domain-containing protein [Bacteroidales bacterium]|jgi:zona occludens toxin (predicted ATPase)|nr:zonular occludens toxin domain-containing protein [Bacteroidales bacterium]